MKKGAFALYYLFIFLALSKSSLAQTTFDLQKLIHMALKQNADVQVQKSQTKISDLQRGQAFSNLLPTLDAEAGYIYSTYRNGNPSFIGANGQRETLAYLSLHQTIYNAAIWGQYQKNNLEEKKQGVLLKKVYQDVILKVVESYFTALKLRGKRQALEENLYSFKLMYKQSQLLFESGSVPELDVKKSHVEFLLQKNGLHQVQKDYKSVLNYLKELIGIPISDKLEISNFSIREMSLDSLSFYKTSALQNNPQWQALQFQHKQALMRRQTALLKNLSIVDANIYYGWDTNPPLSQKNNGWQAVLNLNIPLWHWGAQKADYQIADLQILQIEQTQEKIKKQILQQVVNDYNEARLQKIQILTMAEGKKEAEQAVKMARLGYKEGSITNLELINTQKIFTRSQIEHLAAIYNFYMAKVALFRHAGILEADLEWIRK